MFALNSSIPVLFAFISRNFLLNNPFPLILPKRHSCNDFLFYNVYKRRTNFYLLVFQSSVSTKYLFYHLTNIFSQYISPFWIPIAQYRHFHLFSLKSISTHHKSHCNLYWSAMHVNVLWMRSINIYFLIIIRHRMQDI